MGHDEHGPAYPAGPYRCGVCGTGDRDGYLRCNRPDCLDGRDQYRQISAEVHAQLRGAYPTEEELCKGRPWSTVIVTWAIMIATFVWIFWRH